MSSIMDRPRDKVIVPLHSDKPIDYPDLTVSKEIKDRWKFIKEGKKK